GENSNYSDIILFQGAHFLDVTGEHPTGFLLDLKFHRFGPPQEKTFVSKSLPGPFPYIKMIGMLQDLAILNVKSSHPFIDNLAFISTKIITGCPPGARIKIISLDLAEVNFQLPFAFFQKHIPHGSHPVSLDMPKRRIIENNVFMITVVHGFRVSILECLVEIVN